MSQINKVTRKECPSLFKEIFEAIIEHTTDDHRRNSNFIRQSIVEFRADSFDWYGDVANYGDYVGTWETNVYIYDSEYGTDWDEINELNRVEKEIKVIEVVEWIPAKPN